MIYKYSMQLEYMDHKDYIGFTEENMPVSFTAIAIITKESICGLTTQNQKL